MLKIIEISQTFPRNSQAKKRSNIFHRMLPETWIGFRYRKSQKMTFFQVHWTNLKSFRERNEVQRDTLSGPRTQKYKSPPNRDLGKLERKSEYSSLSQTIDFSNKKKILMKKSNPSRYSSKRINIRYRRTFLKKNLLE